MNSNFSEHVSNSQIQQPAMQEVAVSPAKAEGFLGQKSVSRVTNAEAITVQNLCLAFFAKGRLNSTEKETLKPLAEKNINFFGKIAYQNNENKRIIAAADRVIHHFGKGTIAQDLQTLKDAKASSQQAIKAKAEALLVLTDRREHKLVAATRKAIDKMQADNTPLNAQTLQPIIDDFNAAAEASQMLDKNLPLRFTPKGTLLLVNTRLVFHEAKMQKAPLEINQKLSPAQVAQLRACYEEVMQSPYSNIGPMLDFMSHVGNQSAGTSLRDAFNSFEINGHQLFDKYGGGDCAVCSAKIVEESRKLGFQAGVVGTYIENAWALAPTSFLEGFYPEQPLFAKVSSDSYFRETDFSSHCGVMVVGSDHNEAPSQILGLDPYGNGFQELEVDSKEPLLTSARQRGAFSNPGDIIKSQMLGKYKATTVVGEKIFGYDLVKGNIYINAKGIEGLNGIPKGHNGSCAILLDDLKKPDIMGTYVVDGKNVHITHRQALVMLYEATKERFSFPVDFVSNILSLAKNKEAILSEILTPGTKELIDLEPRGKAMGQRYKAVFEGTEKIKNGLPDHQEEVGQLKMDLLSIRQSMDKVVRGLASGETSINLEEQIQMLEQKMETVCQRFGELETIYNETNWVVNL